MSTVMTQRKADYNQGHPASLPISPDLALPDPVPFTDPDEFTGEPTLNASEIDHFKREGFIVKRGLIKDDNAFAQVIDHIWKHVPRNLMNRAAPDTWVAPPEAPVAPMRLRSTSESVSSTS